MNNKTTPKDFFLYIGSLVCLYIGVFSLANLLFSIIDKLYPTVDRYYYYSSSTVSWPVAALVVLFPLYVVLASFIQREIIRTPEKATILVRKWLLYLTLFAV